MTKRMRVFQWIAVILLLGIGGVSASFAQSLELLVGINYEPAPRGSTAESNVTEAQIAQDLDMIAQKFSTLRVYQSQGLSEQIVTIAAQKQLNVVIEAYLTGDVANDDAEIEKAIALASENNNVSAVIVGNGVLSGGVLSADDLLDAIARVRAGIPADTPIVYSDLFLNWIQNPALAEAVDWIGLESYGFLDCQSIRGSIQYTINQWALLISNPTYSSKKIVVMETGWPTSGASGECENQNQEFTSEQTQTQFIDALLDNATAAQLDVFMFEFADAPWRCEATSEADYGCNWGLVTTDRAPKAAWTSLPDVVRRAPPAPIIGLTATDDQSSANCREEPSTESAVLTLIPNGEEVTIIDRTTVPQWVKVEYDDATCWMHHSLIWVDGLPLPASPAFLDVSATNLRQFLASADPFLCMGATPGELTAQTWTAPDIMTVASCVRNFDVWSMDASAQQDDLETRGVCDVAPSTDETSTQDRFQNIWALDNMAIAYYNLGRSLRRVGEYQLAKEAFEYVTSELSCAWAFDSSGTPYFWSVSQESLNQIGSLPLATVSP